MAMASSSSAVLLLLHLVALLIAGGRCGSLQHPIEGASVTIIEEHGCLALPVPRQQRQGGGVRIVVASTRSAACSVPEAVR